MHLVLGVVEKMCLAAVLLGNALCIAMAPFNATSLILCSFTEQAVSSQHPERSVLRTFFNFCSVMRNLPCSHSTSGVYCTAGTACAVCNGLVVSGLREIYSTEGKSDKMVWRDTFICLSEVSVVQEIKHAGLHTGYISK